MKNVLKAFGLIALVITTAIVAGTTIITTTITTTAIVAGTTIL